MTLDFPITFLVVEMDPAVRALCRETGEALGFGCAEATNGTIALAFLPSLSPDIVLTSLSLEDMTGVELLRQIKILLPRTEIVILTDHSAVDSAVHAIRLGAYHYLTRPLRAQDLQLMLQRIEEKIRLSRENEYLRDRVSNDQELSEITGSSPKIHKVLRLVARLKDTRAPVLITGEKGTGKELVARSIHFRGALAKQPFIQVDCGALDPQTAEMELFGYARGVTRRELAATKPGWFHTARHGTIFLRNIDKLCLEAQDQLLRTIRDGEIYAPGGKKRVKNDVRIIVSTDGSLAKALAEGRFRRDLSSCLNAAAVHMPALRERAGDIPALVHALIQRFAPNLRVLVTGEAMNCLAAYHWPENISELKACIKHALAHRSSEFIDWPDLAPEARANADSLLAKSRIDSLVQIAAVGHHAGSPPRGAGLPAGWGARLEDAERATIAAAMQQAGGDRKAASELLGISRKTLYRKLKSYGIIPPPRYAVGQKRVFTKAGGAMASVLKFPDGDRVSLPRKTGKKGLPLRLPETTDRATLEAIVLQTGGDIATASKLLGIDQARLFRLLNGAPLPRVPAGKPLATSRGSRPDCSE